MSEVNEQPQACALHSRSLLAAFLGALAFTLWDLARIVHFAPALSAPPQPLAFMAVSWALGIVFLGTGLVLRNELSRAVARYGVLGEVIRAVADVFALFTLYVFLPDPSVLRGDTRALALGAGLVCLPAFRAFTARLSASQRRRVQRVCSGLCALSAIVVLANLQTRGSPWPRLALQLTLAVSLAPLLPAAVAGLRLRTPLAVGLVAVITVACSSTLLSNAAWARASLYEKSGHARCWMLLYESLSQPRAAEAQTSRVLRLKRVAKAERVPGAASGSDVIILSVDALRADRIGDLQQVMRELGPHARFERAVSPAPATKESIAATVRGRPVHALELEAAEQGSAPILWRDRSATLAHRLVSAGYRALTVPTSNIAEPRIGVLPGFESVWVANFDARARMPDRSPFEQRYVHADHTIPIVLAAARETPGPLCIWLHLMETHSSYHVSNQSAASAPFDRYRQAVQETDTRLAALVRELTRLRRKQPIVAVFGDHGEEFGEHGGAFHGSTLYAEQVGITLLLAGPGVPEGRYAAPVSTTGLPATILDLLGLDAPSSMLEPSWLPALRGEAAWPALAVSQLRNEHGLVTAYTGARYRYLRDRFREVELLFDSHADPREQRDISALDPKALAHMRRHADAWDAAH